MANLQPFDELTVVTALCQALGNVPGLKTYKLPSPSLEMPAAIPMLEPQWNAGFSGTVSSPIECNILILCGAGDLKSGPMLLFQYTSALGARSVKLALEADPTLGGVINGLRVVGVVGRTYQRFDGDGNLAYVGRYIQVMVYP
jgi:hypothetical protein